MEREAEQAQELVQQCRKRRREIAEESRSLQRYIKAMEVKLPKLRMEIDGFDTSRQELGKLIPDLRAKCELNAGDKAKLKELQKKVDRCRSDMSACRKLTCHSCICRLSFVAPLASPCRQRSARIWREGQE